VICCNHHVRKNFAQSSPARRADQHIGIGIIGRFLRLAPLARRLFCPPSVSLAGVRVAKGVSIVPVQTAVQTIARRTESRRVIKPVHRAIADRSTVRPASSSPATSPRINPAKLEEVENRLLAEAIEHHAQVEAALDGALDDMAVLSAELRRSRRRPLLLRSTTNLNRVEDLLLEAIVRAHPNRENALDRLLADVSDDPTTDHAREEFDMGVDNDFDGMG
jgi:hypothetical protein